jgi:translation initiation factor 1A
METFGRLRTPREGEMFGLVETLLGSNRLRVRCQDGKVRIGRIPGKLRKRVWIRAEDYVIIKPWAIGGDAKGDIVWRFTGTEANSLRRKGILTM